MNFKKIGKVLTSKSVGTGSSAYEKRIYRAAVSQMLRDTVLTHADDLLCLQLHTVGYQFLEHFFKIFI